MRHPHLALHFIRISWRDLLLLLGPAVLVVSVGFWIALKWVKPAPPDTIVMTTGTTGSAFEQTAEEYRGILARDGIKLQILPSEGGLENFHRLNEASFKVDVGFIQSGLVADKEAEGLVSLGSLYYEPL